MFKNMFKKEVHLFFTPQLFFSSFFLWGESLAMDQADLRSEDAYWHEQTTQLDREHHSVIFPKDFFEKSGKINFQMLKKILESSRHYNHIDKKEEWHFLDNDYIYKFESPTLDNPHQIEKFDFCYFWKKQFWNYECLRSPDNTFNDLQCYPYIIFDIYYEKKHLFWIYRSNREKANVHIGMLRCIKEYNINKISAVYNDPNTKYAEDFDIPKNKLYSFQEYQAYREALPPSSTPENEKRSPSPIYSKSKDTPRSIKLEKVQKSRYLSPDSLSGSDGLKGSPIDSPNGSPKISPTSLSDSSIDSLSPSPTSGKEKRFPSPIFSNGKDTPRSKKLEKVRKSRYLSPDSPSGSGSLKGSPIESPNGSPKISPTSLSDSSLEAPQKGSQKSSPSSNLTSSPHGTTIYISSPTIINRSETPQRKRSQGTSPKLSSSPIKSSSPQSRENREISPNRLSQSLPVDYSSPYFEGNRELSPNKSRISQSLPLESEISAAETPKKISKKKRPATSKTS